jgi:hypothetical protein
LAEGKADSGGGGGGGAQTPVAHDSPFNGFSAAAANAGNSIDRPSSATRRRMPSLARIGHVNSGERERKKEKERERKKERERERERERLQRQFRRHFRVAM